MKSLKAFLLSVYILTDIFLCSETIDFNAKSISFDNTDNVIMMFDSIDIKSSDFTLTCDTVIVFRNENILNGWGRIVLTMDSFEIKGESIVFNYEKEQGKIFNAKTKIDKGFLTGGIISTYKKDEYYIDDGYFTTCEDSIPHYTFYSSNMHLYQNDRVIVRPLVMYVKNVPVFAIPFFVIPVATTRKSGFLMPKIGYNTYDGKYLKQLSYFYAVNDFSDMTFSADILENRGLLFFYELRVIVNPLLETEINASYIDEFSGSRRWTFAGSYSHNLPLEIALKSRWDLLSDISTQSDYSDTIALNLKRTAKSFASLSKDFGIYNSFVSFDRNQDFSIKKITMQIPNYSGYFNKVTLFKIKYLMGNGLSYYHSHQFSNTFVSDSLTSYSSKNYILNNKLDTYYKIFKYITLTPFAGINYSSTQSLDSLSLISQSSAVSLGTQIYGLSVFGFLFYEKFRHTFSPNIAVSQLKKYFLNSPVTSNTDSSTSSYGLNFSVSNLFEGKRDSIKDLIFRNTISAYYDLKKDSFSEAKLTFHFYPEKKINLLSSIAFNPYDRTYRFAYTLSADIGVKNPFASKKDIAFNLSHSLSYVEDSIVSNSINGSMKVYVGENMDAALSTNYDVMKREFISSAVSFERSLHCWKAYFRVSTYGETFKYDFGVSLVDIPEVSLDKGILGPLLQ